MKKHYLILSIGAMITITGCKKSKLNKELVNSSYILHNLNKPYSASYWNGSTEGDLNVINKVGTNTWKTTTYPDSGGGSGGTTTQTYAVVINSASLNFTKEGRFTYQINATANWETNTYYYYNAEQRGTYELISKDEIQLTFETTNSTIKVEYYIDGDLFHTSDLPAITSTNFTPTSYSYEISQTEDILTLSVMETDQELSAYADVDIGYNNKHIFLIHNGIMQIDFLRTE